MITKDQKEGTESNGGNNDRQFIISPANSGNRATNMFSSFKFLGLGLLSFLIPIIYFLQANELKKKEIKTAETTHINDSLKLVLQFYADTSLKGQRLLALENYIRAQKDIAGSYGGKNDSPADLSPVLSKLNFIQDDINRLLKRPVGNTTVTKDFPSDYVTKTDLNKNESTIVNSLEEQKKLFTQLSKDLSEIKAGREQLRSISASLIGTDSLINSVIKNNTSMYAIRFGNLITPGRRIAEMRRLIDINSELLQKLSTQIKTTLVNIDRR